MSQVILQDIAKALNVSSVADTKVLKVHPDIANKTRESAIDFAIRQGYTK